MTCAIGMVVLAVFLLVSFLVLTIVMMGPTVATVRHLREKEEAEDAIRETYKEWADRVEKGKGNGESL